MKQRLQHLKSLFVQTYSEWDKHDAPTLGAALSYYTCLSLAPLLVVAVSIAGIVFGRKAVEGQIVAEMKGLVGSGANAIQNILAHAQSPKAGLIASIIGFILLLSGAAGVFSELRTALNRIWDVKPVQTSGLWNMLRQQFFSFSMVIGIGFLLLVSLLVTAFLSGAAKFAGNYVPAGLLHAVNLVVSLVVITVVFALIYRFVPEQTLPWRPLWPGSFATAVLFVIGKYLLGLYLGRASVTSAYGAAGSLVVLLIWVYYSSQLFLFGAEFTRIYACHFKGVCLNLERARSNEKTVASGSPAPSNKIEATSAVNRHRPAGSAKPINILGLVGVWVLLRKIFRPRRAP